MEEKKGLTEDAKKKAKAALSLTTGNNKRPREEKLSVDDIAKTLGLSRATFYRYLDWAKKDESLNKEKKKVK